MKIGNFTAIWLSPSLALGPPSPYRQCLGGVLVTQLGQAHGIEQMADGRLQLLHRPLQVAAQLLRTSTVLEAAHDADRSLERPDDLPHRDVARPARQDVAALGSVLANDQAALGEPLQDLRKQLGGNTELLRDALGADSAEPVVAGDVVDRHQPVIGSLREPEHRCLPLIPDSFYRRPFQSHSHTAPATRQREMLAVTERSPAAAAVPRGRAQARLWGQTQF